MPSLLSRYQQDVSPRAISVALAVLALAAFLINLAPTKHPLLINATAWLAVWAHYAVRVNSGGARDHTSDRKTAWELGALLALAQVCEEIVGGIGLWWAKVLLPAAVHVFARGKASGRSDEKTSSNAQSSATSIVTLTVCALAAAWPTRTSPTTVALGSCWAVITAIAYTSVEGIQEARSSSDGSLGDSGPRSKSSPRKDSATATASLMRDLSLSAALILGVASIALESWKSPGITYQSLLGAQMGRDWVLKQSALQYVYILGTVFVWYVGYSVQLLLIQTYGAITTALLPLFATISAYLYTDPSIARVWFGILSICVAFAVLEEADMLGSRRLAKARRLLTVLAALSLVVLAVLQLQRSITSAPSDDGSPPSANSDFVGPPPSPLHPLEYTNSRVHPVDQLVRTAEAAWLKELQSQSVNLGTATTEYRRRYKISPPPHFDKWYDFAKSRNVQLIDEYDTIYHSLLPFWALPPAIIRSRVREALGFSGNNLIGLHIRDGKVVHIEGGQEWQQQATVGMMEKFVQYLPDMDLAFNIHDEPRVVVPHDELSRMVRTASEVSLPTAALSAKPNNGFSPRPKDLRNGLRIAEVKTTLFNVFAHQPVWIPSRLSCSPDSPARTMDETTAADNLTSYALGDLGFIYNQTAFSDICSSPSFATSHGFFDRPNAFNVIHELVPIFSQSKMSSFQDILYPSPWYWFEKVAYDEKRDKEWKLKESRLWWRGSTTGGFSRDGGWRRQHRQQFVRKVSARDQAKVLTNTRQEEADAVPDWQVKEVPRQDFKDVMDVHFSHVGQCDPGDCDAQREFFDVVPPADQQDAWNFKYLLDIDGNAFSGRFYAFLKSRSLTFKMAVFREWHEEWVKPWVHYIPLSLRGDEVLEVVRYFAGETEGKQQGVRMAEAGREWAGKALRKEDFEAWFFRLLLEYGRIVDDDRNAIGYS
ncbi:hypothetical protein LTR95_006573 [Oleoguttula sp. CCFEE 5521]